MCAGLGTTSCSRHQMGLLQSASRKVEADRRFLIAVLRLRVVATLHAQACLQQWGACGPTGAARTG